MPPPYVHIKSRRDTAKNWYATNGILQDGEIGIETDTNRMKVGDGVTNWNNIVYSYNAQYDPYLIHFTHNINTAFIESAAGNIIRVTGKWAVNQARPVINATTGLPTESLSAYLFQKTNTDRTRLTIKPFPITSTTTDFTDIRLDLYFPSTYPFVAGNEYQIEVVNEENVVVGAYNLTYRPNHRIEFKLGFVSNDTIRAYIQTNTTLASGGTIQLYARSSDGRTVAPFSTLFTLTRTITQANGEITIDITLPPTLRFQSGDSYYGVYTYNTTNQYEVVSTESTYYTQTLGDEILFNRRDNNKLTVSIIDANPTQSVFFNKIIVESKRGSADYVLVGQITPPSGGRFDPGNKSITLNEVAGYNTTNEDLIRVTGSYGIDATTSGDPVILNTTFVQSIELNSVLITSRDSFVVNANRILGETKYDVGISIIRGSRGPTGPVALGGFNIPAQDLEVGQQTNVEAISGATTSGPPYAARLQPVTSTVAKPFYGITMSAFNTNTRIYTLANIKSILEKALRLAPRIRIYGGGVSDDRLLPVGIQTFNLGGPYHSALLLDMILQVIKNEPPGSELKKLQISAAISVTTSSSPSQTNWNPTITRYTTDYNRCQDLLYVLEKYGTSNIIGISLGNEIWNGFISSSYSRIAVAYAFNNYYLTFQYLREYFDYYNRARVNTLAGASGPMGPPVPERDSAGRPTYYRKDDANALAVYKAEIAASRGRVTFEQLGTIPLSTSDGQRSARVTNTITSAELADTYANNAEAAAAATGVHATVKTQVDIVVARTRAVAGAVLRPRITSSTGNASLNALITTARAAAGDADAARNAAELAASTFTDITGYTWGDPADRQPIYGVPLGIMETPAVATNIGGDDMLIFDAAIHRSLIEMCDFVGVNIHPFYSGVDTAPGANLDRAWTAVGDTYTLCLDAVRRYNSNALVVIGEIGVPASSRYDDENDARRSADPTFLRTDAGATVLGAGDVSNRVVLTVENQQYWVRKIADELNLPFYYFALTDNHVQMGFPALKGSTARNAYSSKGNYIVNWGLYQYDTTPENDIIAISPTGGPGGRPLYTAGTISGFTLEQLAKEGNYPFRTTTLTAKTNYDASGAISKRLFLDTSIDITYADDYPDLYRATPIGSNAFLEGYNYNFTFLAGGKSTNVYKSTSSGPILGNVLSATPFTGNFVFNDSLSNFASESSVELAFTYTGNRIPDAQWYIRNLTADAYLTLVNNIIAVERSASTVGNPEFGVVGTISTIRVTLVLTPGSTFQLDNLYEIGVSNPSDPGFTPPTIELTYLPVVLKALGFLNKSSVQFNVKFYDDNSTHVKVQLYRRSAGGSSVAGPEIEIDKNTANFQNGEDGAVGGDVNDYTASVNFPEYYNISFYLQVKFIIRAPGRSDIVSVPINSKDKKVELTGLRFDTIYFKSNQIDASITLLRNAAITEIKTYYPAIPAIPASSTAPAVPAVSAYYMPIRCDVFNKAEDVIGRISESTAITNLYLDDTINGVLTAPGGGPIILDFMDGDTIASSNTGVYSVKLYAVDQANAGADTLILSSNQLGFRDYSRYTSFSTPAIEFITKTTFRAKVSCSNLAYKRKVIYNVKESSNGSAATYAVIADDQDFPTSLITSSSSANTGSTENLRGTNEFKINYYYKLTGTVDFKGDGTDKKPITDSNAVRYVYDQITLTSTNEDSVTKLVTKTIKPTLKWKGNQASGKIQIFKRGDARVKYETPNADIINLRKTTALEDITTDSIAGSGFLTPGDTYDLKFKFTGDNVTSVLSSFTYIPLGISSLGITYDRTNVRIEVDWSNRLSGASAVIPFNIIQISGPVTTVKKTITGNVSNNTFNFSFTRGTLTNGLRYFIRVDLPEGVTPYYQEFTYTVPDVDVTSEGFRDILASTDANYTLGQMFINYKFVSISTEVTEVRFNLYEYPGESGIAGKVKVDGAITSNTDPVVSRDETIAISTKNLIINKWYEVWFVPYVESSLGTTEGFEFILSSERLQYTPKGFDIIILAGADNMVGRDRYFASMPFDERQSGTHRVRRDVNYPQIIPSETETTLTDTNRNSVKIYNFLKSTGTLGNDPITNESRNYLHRFVGPVSSFTYDPSDATPPSNTLPSTGGTSFPPPPQQSINCGHEFIKYYTSESALTASNRQICVIPVAIPLSNFDATGTSGAGVWNKPNGRLYKNIAAAVGNIVHQDTLTTMTIGSNTLRRANQSKSLKYGCQIQAGGFKYSQKIVDNFDYCYLIEDISLSEIHPSNDGNIANDNFNTQIDPLRRNPTSYLPRELKRLRGITLSAGDTASFPPFNYTYGYRESDYNFESIRPVAEFLRDNGMKLRINGLISFDDTGLLASGFWLNTAAMGTNDNAIWAIMRHCYVVVNWFTTNFPGLVVAYDVIRNYYNTVSVKTYIQEGGAQNTTSNLKFVDRSGSYSAASPSFEFAQAAFIGAYAACKADYDAGKVDLSWSDVRLDRYRRDEYSLAVNTGELDNVAVLLKDSLATIYDNYLTNHNVIFPINSISFQSHYDSGDFITDPADDANNDRNQYNEYILGTEGTPARSLLHNTLGVLRNRIYLFQNIGTSRTQLDLKIEFTEFDIGRSAAVSGNRDNEGKNPSLTQYWDNGTLKFRKFQYEYFIEPFHEFIRNNASFNINRKRLGYGGFASSLDSGRQRAFFFQTNGSTVDETTNINELRTYKTGASYDDDTHKDTTYTNYTAHRIKAFLWEGGGRMYGNFNSTLLSTQLNNIITGLATTLPRGGVDVCRPDKAIYLIGNDEYGFVCRQIATGLPAPVVIPTYDAVKDIDRIDQIAVLSTRDIQSVSTIGLHSIDPNAPWSMSHNNTTPKETLGYLIHGCFSARSQRILGLRFFNAFLYVYNGSPATETQIVTNFPVYAIEKNSTPTPTDYTYDTLDGTITNVYSNSCSFKHNKQPIAYLISATYKVIVGGAPPASTIKHAILTEYHTVNRIASTDSRNYKAFIPYFTDTTNVSTPPSSIINGSKAITLAGSAYNISNVMKIDYTVPTISNNTIINANNTLKNLYSLDTNIRSFIEETVGANIGFYDGVQLLIKAITCNNNSGSSVFSLDSSTIMLPPVSLVKFYSLFSSGGLTDAEYGADFLDMEPENTKLKMSPLGISHCFLDVSIRGGIFVGCSPTYTSIPATGRFGYKTETVSSTNYSILGSTINPIQATGPKDNSSSVFNYTGGTHNIYSTANNGRLYSTIKKDLDWFSFVSRARYNTRRTVDASLYASYTYGNQYAGICWTRVDSLLDPRNPPASAERFPFFFISNSETYIVIKLHNIHVNKEYTLTYSFSVRDGRVPYAYTLDRRKNIPVGSIDYNFNIEDPFPVSVYSKNPLTDTSVTPFANQNLNFEHNTIGANPLANRVTGTTTDSYLHTSAASLWDGSWVTKEFKFRALGSVTFDASTAYLQFGPLPYRSMVETSFNFANIVLKIEN